MPKQAFTPHPSSNVPLSSPMPPPGPVTTHAPLLRPTVQSSPHPSQAQHSDFKLPQIPIRPFVPMLLPPHALGHGQTNEPSTRVPQLLQINDPLTRMRRDGFKLLKEEPLNRRNERTPELKLCQVEQGPPSTCIKPQDSIGEPRQPVSQPVMTEQARERPEVAETARNELQVSSTCTLTTVTSAAEESSEVLPHTDRVERPIRAGRRQRRRGKGVAWKLDHGKSEEPASKDDTGVNADLGVVTTQEVCEVDAGVIRSSKDEVEHSPVDAPTNAEVEAKKPARQPLIGLSREKHSYPDEVPLERLELRRLEINSSFIPSSPQDLQTVTTPHSNAPFPDAQLSSPVKAPIPQTSEIGVQVDPMLVSASSKTAVQVSPEHLSGVTEEDKGIKGDKPSVVVDSVEGTSVSSLDSEGAEVQLSESEDEILPATAKQDEFTPPPLWYNSHSPIPIPIKTQETSSPIPEAHHTEEAPSPSSHYAGFSATPPPPLPLAAPTKQTFADNRQVKSPKSNIPSPIPETPHQLPPRLEYTFTIHTGTVVPLYSGDILRIG